MSTLTDRIVLLLRSEATSEALAEVIEEARDELATLTEACEDAKERMLDPLSTSSVVANALKQLDESTLQVQRLNSALGHLTAQLESARHREAQSAKVQRYEEAKAERDALVEDIRRIYPEAAAAIAALLPRIEPLDKKIMAANQDLPDGASYLELVEHVARGRPNHQGTYLSQSVRLPALMQQDIAWNSFWPVKQH
jgi:DNA repair exonuclease SbcCD ATPase subunit